MSDNIPFEIQEEIINRLLCVKSLIRFRSVSKQWKSLIDSSEFITRHSINNSNTQHPHQQLLVSYNVDSEKKYVSIDDNDDSFPQHKFTPVVPPSVNLVRRLSMTGSSHGLVCLSGVGPDLPSKLIVVWNPSIRKSVGVMSPSGTRIVGFGLCPKTNDPKIIAVTRDQEAEVFTLSTKSWRSVPLDMFHGSIKFRAKQVVIDGVIHWSAIIYDPDDDEYQTIVSFDFSSEEFRQVTLPDRIAHGGCVQISKLNDSLAVIDFLRVDDSGPLIHDVWVMKNGVPKSSFTKLYTVQDEPSVYRIIGFRMNGQPVIALSVGSWEDELEVYEPNSQRMNGLGIYGSFFSMVNYTESLLLLNHPDSIVLPYN